MLNKDVVIAATAVAGPVAGMFWGVSAGASLSFGKEVEILGTKYSLVSVSGDITVNANHLYIGGSVSILGGLFGSGFGLNRAVSAAGRYPHLKMLLINVGLGNQEAPKGISLKTMLKVVLGV